MISQIPAAPNNTKPDADEGCAVRKSVPMPSGNGDVFGCQ